MLTPGDIPELREIAAMDLALARRLYGQAMAEPDTETAADITRAYNRVTRSLRQSIALRARLAQGWENHHVYHGRRADLTAESPTMPFRTRAEPAPTRPAASILVARAEAERRRNILQRAIQRIVWNERETERLDRPSAARLRDRIADEVLGGPADPAFAGSPVERLVAAAATACATIPNGKPCPSRPTVGSTPEWNSPTTGEGRREVGASDASASESRTANPRERAVQAVSQGRVRVCSRSFAVNPHPRLRRTRPSPRCAVGGYGDIPSRRD